MHYAGCCDDPTLPECAAHILRCVEDPTTPDCQSCEQKFDDAVGPFHSFQRLAESNSAQDLCLEAGRYDCRYVFRQALDHVPCREGYCIGNTLNDTQPDITCEPPAVLVPDASERAGRDAAACCMTVGMCVGDTEGEPDVVCEFPAELRPDPHLIHGRVRAPQSALSLPPPPSRFVSLLTTSGCHKAAADSFACCRVPPADAGGLLPRDRHVHRQHRPHRGAQPRLPLPFDALPRRGAAEGRA